MNDTSINDVLTTHFVLYKGHFYFFDYTDKQFIPKFKAFFDMVKDEYNLSEEEWDFDSVNSFLESGLNKSRSIICGSFDSVKDGDIAISFYYKPMFDIKHSDELNKIMKFFSNISYYKIDGVLYSKDELQNYKYNTSFKLGEYIYHGTSLDNMESILKYGLRADKKGTSLFNQEKDITWKDYIFFTTSFLTAKSYAKMNVIKDYNLNNKKIVLEIKTSDIDKNLIEYDFDFYAYHGLSGNDDYDAMKAKLTNNKSLPTNKKDFKSKTNNFNKFGYKGNILPSKICRIFICDEKKWYTIDEFKEAYLEVSKIEESYKNTITLYHGTCEANAQELVTNGFTPRDGFTGGNMGQSNLLYTSSNVEDALWFAEEKGCSTVVKIENVPLDYIKPDPEDEAGFTMKELLDRINNTPFPAKFAIYMPLSAHHFTIIK